MKETFKENRSKDVETSTKLVINLQLNSKRHLKLNVEKDLCCLTALPGYILMAGFDLLHAKMFHSSKWSISPCCDMTRCVLGKCSACDLYQDN